MGFFGDIITAIAGNEAADAQADATVEGNKRAAQTQMQMFNESNRLNAPTRIAGDRTRDEMLALMGMAPTSGFATTGAPTQGGDYVAANPDIQNAFTTLSPENKRHLVSGGFDTDGDGQISSGEFGRFHHERHGAGEGRAFGPAIGGGGALPANAFAAEGAQDAAYERFMNGGFARSMLETTQSDFDMIRDASGAGGVALSGQYLESLNDANRKNTNNAFTQHWNALGGMSGQATQVSAQQGRNALQVGNNLGNLQMGSANARGSSYANQANTWGNVANSAIDELGKWAGGF